MEQNKKIRLMVITPTLQCGGSEKYVSLLCNNIDTDQFELTVVVLDSAAPFYTINVSVIDLKVKHVRNSLFKLRSTIKKYQPDIVLAAANHLNIFLAIFKWVLPKKLILVARESSVVSVNSKRAKFPTLYNWLLKKYYRRFDHIICQSQYMQQDLIGNYRIQKENTTVINNPVEADATAVKNAVPGKIKLLAVSRLSEEKGISRLIKAVSNLTMPFQFYIAGGGDKINELQQLIGQLQLQQKVFLLGPQQHPFNGMEDATLFLMGSYYEGFPNSLLEAGALGIPVIAFDVPGGINEIIADGENGLLVKGGDEKSFALAIEKALTLNFNRQQIKSQTFQKFAATAIVKKVEALLVHIFQQRQ